MLLLKFQNLSGFRMLFPLYLNVRKEELNCYSLIWTLFRCSHFPFIGLF